MGGLEKNWNYKCVLNRNLQHWSAKRIVEVIPCNFVEGYFLTPSPSYKILTIDFCFKFTNGNDYTIS